jgi:hypothetical protein
VLSTESTDAQPISTHPVQPVEIRLFTVKSGLYAALDSFVVAVSSALLIVGADFSRISALSRILPGHQYAEGALLDDHQLEVVRNSYHTQKLSQAHILYDQLVYPLIFWTGSGCCSLMES